MGLIAVRLAALGAQLRRRLGPDWPAWRYRQLVVMWLVAFLLTCNIYLLATVMPAVVRGLGSTVGAVEPAMVLSPLMTAALVPGGQRLLLLRGRRRILTWSLLAYGAGLIVAGLSVSAAMLTIGFALIAGVAGAPLLASAWTAVDEMFGTERRAFGVMLLGTAPGAGSIVGPFLGGLIAEESTWRLAFAGEVVLVAVILWLFRATPESDPVAQKAVNWFASLPPLAGLACVLVAISFASDYGWWTATKVLRVGQIRLPPGPLSISPWLLGLGAALLVVSLVSGSRRSRDGRPTIWRTGPFASRRFAVGLLLSLSVGTSTVGVLYSLLLFFPAAEGLNKLQAGIAVVPFGAGAVAVNVAVLRLRRPLNPRLAVGTGMVASAVALGILFAGVTAFSGGLALAPGLLLLGVGNGLALAHMSGLTLAEVAPLHYTEASGINASVSDLGYSLGIAILGAVFVGVIAQAIISGVEQHAAISIPAGVREQIVARLENDLRTLTPEEQDAFVESQPPNFRRAIRLAVDQAFRQGMGYTLAASLGGLALGFVLLGMMPSGARGHPGPDGKGGRP